MKLAGILLALLTAMAVVGPATAADRPVVVYAGATGSIGRLALPLLVERGYAVRAIARNPARAKEQYGDRYEWVHADVRDPAQLKEILAGADYVVCSVGYTGFQGPNGPQFVDYMGVRNLVDAALGAGVKHFVLVSAGNNGPWRNHAQNPRFGYVAWWKEKGERYLKQSGIPFTIVGPTGFTNDEAGKTGIRVASRKDYRMGTIARGDVAAVTAGVVGERAAFGRSLFIINDATVKPGTWKKMIGEVQPEPDVPLVDR